MADFNSSDAHPVIHPAVLKLKDEAHPSVLLIKDVIN